MAILTASSLTIGYRGHSPVAGPLDLTLEQGRMTVLLGANGCGKSTLLRTVAGAQPPVSGRLMLGDADIARLKPAELAKAVSLVCTDRTMAGGLTVEQTVALGRQPHTGFFGRLSAADRAVVSEAMETMGIGNMRDRYTATLSDGERQKTMIARALAQETPLIILDEPTTFLDVAARLDVMAMLQRLASQGKTILFSTHDVTEALAVAPHAWLMTQGTVTSGPVDALIASGALNHLFLDPRITFNPTSRTFTLSRQG